MNINEQLQNDLKVAMKAHDKTSLNVIRMLKADLTNEQLKLGHELTEEEILTVLSRAKKQRNDSITEFKKGNRDDLVDETEKEIVIVEKYLPAQLSEDELRSIVQKAIDQTGANSASDIGKVMGVVIPQTKGQASGGQINSIARELLQ